MDPSVETYEVAPLHCHRLFIGRGIDNLPAKEEDVKIPGVAVPL